MPELPEYLAADWQDEYSSIDAELGRYVTVDDEFDDASFADFVAAHPEMLDASNVH